MSEKEIAKKNFIKHNHINTFGTKEVCQEHLASCKRFLEFLKDGVIGNNTNDKIKDLQQAIKIYNEVGLK